MTDIASSFFSSAVIPFRFVFLMWVFFAVEHYLGIPLSDYGTVPRTEIGLLGVLFSPLLHGNLQHIVSNTFPMLFLGGMLFYFYPKIANRVFLLCYFITNLMVWALARGEFNHIGASGLVYGVAFFLMFFGIFKKEIKSILISIGVLILYSSLFLGIFPGMPHISWETHLFGGIVGVGCAYIYSR